MLRPHARRVRDNEAASAKRRKQAKPDYRAGFIRAVVTVFNDDCHLPPHDIHDKARDIDVNQQVKRIGKAKLLQAPTNAAR